MLECKKERFEMTVLMWGLRGIGPAVCECGRRPSMIPVRLALAFLAASPLGHVEDTCTNKSSLIIFQLYF